MFLMQLVSCVFNSMFVMSNIRLHLFTVGLHIYFFFCHYEIKSTHSVGIHRKEIACFSREMIKLWAGATTSMEEITGLFVYRFWKLFFVLKNKENKKNIKHV